jgi:hypothetical protein
MTTRNQLAYSKYPYTDEVTIPQQLEYQIWHPTPYNSYPSTFTEAPSASHQIFITDGNGNVSLQGLDPVRGPMSWPVYTYDKTPLPYINSHRPIKQPFIFTPYPTNSSVLSAYNANYVWDLPGGWHKRTY